MPAFTANRISVAMLAVMAAVALPGDAAGQIAAESHPPARSSVDWAGDGTVRLVVEVPPADIQGRPTDELVASYSVDFHKVLADLGFAGTVDLGSIQVHQIDPSTGIPLPFAEFEGSRSAFDRPVRFDDNDLPEDYPSRVGRASETTDGRARKVIQPRKDRLFNREIVPEAGKLVWVHTQTGSDSSHYAIYFNVIADDMPQVAPAPWIGDADVLRRASAQPLGGYAHFSVTAGDLNGDGLIDLIAGTEKGDVIWFPNHGSPEQPLFIGSQVLLDDAGPIDTGWYASPFLVDWNNDGLLDLLVGTSGNVILWWENAGTQSQPSLIYRGFVQADSARLEVPEGPVPEDHADIFKRDYYNQPWIGDWDGDGISDLLTGGYVTGHIFFYRGTGRDADGVLQLTYVGPLEADGQVLDTIWSAAPSAGDVDGDGLPELITGAWYWSGISEKPAPGQDDYLYYYRYTGSRDAGLTRKPLPKDGPFPRGQIARPTLVDLNGDGLLDLLVSDGGGNVRLFPNIGSASAPQWRMDPDIFTVPWGFVCDEDFTATLTHHAGTGNSFVFAHQQFMSVEGTPYSPQLLPRGRATVNGKPISHPGPGYGDPYYYTTLHDWDGDGIDDLLWGTQQGNIYFHRGGVDPGNPFDFVEGQLMKLASGQPIQVGPPVVESPEEANNFTLLQGSRILMAVADFDGDGIDDLVVSETFGNIWFFRNRGAGSVDQFDEPVLLTKMSGRSACLMLLDWNNDGKPDVLVEGTTAKPGVLYLNQTEAGNPAVAEASYPFALPFMFWGPRFGMTDWNSDGDADLMVTSEFFTFFVERSFLVHGYQSAELLSTEVQPSAGKGQQ